MAQDSELEAARKDEVAARVAREQLADAARADEDAPGGRRFTVEGSLRAALAPAQWEDAELRVLLQAVRAGNSGGPGRALPDGAREVDGVVYRVALHFVRRCGREGVFPHAHVPVGHVSEGAIQFDVSPFDVQHLLRRLDR